MKKRTEIDFGFIDRTLKTTCLVLLVFFPFGIYYLGFFTSLSILSGGIWGMLNLILITKLVRHTLHPDGPDMLKAIGLGLIKFPLLYTAGYLLLKVSIFDSLNLLIGFSGVLVIIVLKILGRAITGLDNKSERELRNKEISTT